MSDRTVRFIVVLIVVYGLCGLWFAANGAEPQKSDFAPWFRSLTDKQGKSCCGLGDGHLVDARVQNGKYQFFWEGNWYDVPDEKVVNNHSNPTGSYVVFFLGNSPSQIYCFVRAVET